MKRSILILFLIASINILAQDLASESIPERYQTKPLLVVPEEFKQLNMTEKNLTNKYKEMVKTSSHISERIQKLQSQMRPEDTANNPRLQKLFSQFEKQLNDEHEILMQLRDIKKRKEMFKNVSN